MSTTNKLFVSCLFCFVLVLVSGCGGGVPKLTPAEQAEADKYIKEHGKDAILDYMSDIYRNRNTNKNTDEKLNIRYVQYFVSKGADVNAKGGHEKVTPLHLAALFGNVELAKFLLAKGADINAKTVDGYSPLRLAFPMIGLDDNDINVEFVKFLVSNGADVYENYGPDKYGPLTFLIHSMTVQGKLDLVQLFVSKGVDVNTRDVNGATPLHHAAEMGNIDIAKFLISKGADINAKRGGGVTPLYCAAEKTGNIEVVQFLVSKGADVNAGDYATPLFAAADKGDIGVVKFLVSKGADVNVKDAIIGETPLDKAKRRGNMAIVDYLISVGAKSGKDL